MSIAITGTLVTGGRDSAAAAFSSGCPVILCVNTWVPESTITASSAEPNRPAVAARSPITSTYWKPTTLPAWLEADAGQARDFDYAAVYVRMPPDTAAEFAFETSDDGETWTQHGESAQIVKSGSIAWLFDRVTAHYARIRVDGDQAPLVATMQCGLATAVPAGPEVGYEPGVLNPQDEYSNNFSEGGQVLGASLRRVGVNESLQLAPIKPEWVRDNWLTLRQQWRRGGTFLIWNHKEYPRDVVYGVLDGQPSTYYSHQIYMGIRFNLRGPEA